MTRRGLFGLFAGAIVAPVVCVTPGKTIVVEVNGREIARAMLATWMIHWREVIVPERQYEVVNFQRLT